MARVERANLKLSDSAYAKDWPKWVHANDANDLKFDETINGYIVVPWQDAEVLRAERDQAIADCKELFWAADYLSQYFDLGGENPSADDSRVLDILTRLSSYTQDEKEEQ